MDPLSKIRETAKGIKTVLALARDINTDMKAWEIVKTVNQIQPIIAKINKLGGKSYLPIDERGELIGIAMDIAVTNPQAREEFLRLLEEYDTAFRSNKIPQKHRIAILQEIKRDPSRRTIKMTREFIKAVNNAKKEHAVALLEAMEKHGLEVVHPVAKKYIHAEPHLKDIIAESLRRAERPEHVNKILEHAERLRKMDPEIGKRTYAMLKTAESFDEVEQILRAAHHADAAVRLGGKRNDVLATFESKEQLLRKYGRPWGSPER